MPYKIDVNFEEIMDIYSENHTAEKQKSLAEVYEFANQKHAGMTRGTGEPFIYHPMRVAKMIAEWGFGSTLIKAALLHDVVEDCNTSLEEIEAGYKRLITENGEKCQESLDYLQTVFHPHFNSGIPELEKYRDYIVNFIYNPRSTISIYRQISHEANNIEKDLPLLLNKENIALYDLVLILKDELMDNVSFVHPDDVFFQYFDKTLSKKGFHLVRRCRTTHKDSYYYLIADETNNLYRFFVRTEQEYKRYMLGNIIDTDCELSIDEINEIDPRETYNEKIKVFCRNGSFMMIEKGATVLDFAFHIDKELGYHFGHAYLDDSKTSLAANTKLNEGDMITIVPDENIKPDITWFRDVKTLKSVNYLVHYFQKIMGM